MKILVVSDTHGSLRGLQAAIKAEGKLDWILHMGDVDRQEDELAALAGRSMFACVKGNNDYYSQLSNELLLDIRGYKIWMTHGHRYQVYSGNDMIKNVGIMKGADIIMYGHTHSPLVEIDKENKITVINPGSISQPRQLGRQPSYIVMEIEEGKTPSYEIKYLDKELAVRSFWF
ncbi:MAG: metallophosphoesterase [Lachnospiraceae bacterium]|nr:metallophosphoesterase [Lachnospiraceae bacterium]